MILYLISAEENQQMTISFNTQTQISCSFNDDNCGWYTSVYNDGHTNVRHWSRKSCGIPSVNTGPTSGHICEVNDPIKGRFCVSSYNPTNHYVYTEASGYLNTYFDLIYQKPNIS